MNRLSAYHARCPTCALAALAGALLLSVAPRPTSADEPPPPAPSADRPDPAPADAEEAPEAPHPAPLPPRNATPRAGDTVQIIFVSGDAAEGQIVEVRDDAYRVLIGGLEVTVAHSDLEDIIVLPPIEERFREMRGLIEPDDYESMSALASWAYERGLNEQALDVVIEALVYEPNDPTLRTLRDMLEAQIAMDRIKGERRARDAQNGAQPIPPADPDGPVYVPRPWPDFPLLTDEQIDLVKVYEVNLRRPPRIIIDRSTIDALLQNYATNPLIPTTRTGRDAFRRRPPAEILDMMFRVRARELYPEVRIVGHPASMRAFRDYVQSGWLVNSCASNRCHGGEDAQGLVLFNRKPTASRSVYTNFLILERYRTADGTPLIDYQSPERSLLLQMGLPRDEAITPHPDVRGWAPVFRSRDSRAFDRAVRWINMVYRPRPDHPIDYVPPGQEPEPSLAEPQGEPVER